MQISVECPASRLHVCADFAIVSDKPEAVVRGALMAEVPRLAKRHAASTDGSAARTREERGAVRQ